MKYYIENWLKNSLSKIVEQDKEEVIATGQGISGK
jgi:hypothetical protein